LYDAVVGPAAALLAGDEPGVDELFEVVGDRGLGQADRVGQVADAGFAVGVCGDQGQQSDPGRVTECLEDVGEPFGRRRGRGRRR